MKKEILLTVIYLLLLTDAYKIGVGIADMTGPVAEVAFMGYSHPDQLGKGLHLRQFARAFIIHDSNRRIVFVSADAGMMGTAVRKEVLARLNAKYGKLYNGQNVMLSGTHTHSTPGGFLMDIIFDLNTVGFVRETFDAYASGIFRAIQRAHDRLTDGKIYLTHGEIINASINRSPMSYLLNPSSERAKYKTNVDKRFKQLKFVREDGRDMGVLTWFAVHATSMNNTNRLVSSDNVGLASVLFENRVNTGGLVGKGPFVAAFASTNLGDVSPNIKGPKCHISGEPCDAQTSTCKNTKEKCIASGPGKNMFESTRIIATRIVEKAYAAWQTEGKEITGPINSVHQYVHMPSQKVHYVDPETKENKTVKGCLPAMGYSFAAGTTDGPGAFSFEQGTKSTNPLWNALTDFIAKPSKEQIACQAPKPILLATGEMNFPFEWQPSVVSTHLAVIGDFAIACVPGEFTTMSGRRMREAVAGVLNISEDQVTVAGLCNTYSDYIVTPQEYDGQRYEAASTIFGRHTLTIYLELYKKLARHIKQNTKPKPGPDPPENFNDLISLLPPVLFDYAGWSGNFGDVVRQPEKAVKIGDIVSAEFIAGHPRNKLMQESTFLTIDKQNENGEWKVIATDANWETKFIWKRTNPFLGESIAEIKWHIPSGTEPGTYRIRHFGNFKYVYGRIDPYQGISESFQVM